MTFVEAQGIAVFQDVLSECLEEGGDLDDRTAVLSEVCRALSGGAQEDAARIVYRKDLTHLGWPLAAELRATLRAGGSLSDTTFQPLYLGDQ